MIVDQDGNLQPDMQSPKRRGRPKGSKNKKEPLKSEVLMSTDWVIAEPDYTESREFITVKLQSDQVPDGLEATVSRYIIVAISALPNGNASLITNIGAAQPLILVTVEPYKEVVNRLLNGGA